MRNFLVTLLSSCAALVGQQADSSGSKPAPAPRLSWSAQTLAALATLPVQDGGRIKPLSALAASTLHLVHGRRDMKLDTDGDGKPDVTLTPIEWLLDVWCFPEQAADYPLVRIENVDVLDAIGIPHEGGQRFDFVYVAYRQFASAGRAKENPGTMLMRLAAKYRDKAANQRTPVEAHLVHTAEQLHTYDRLQRYPRVLAAPFGIEGEEFRKRLGGKVEMWATELAQQGDPLRALLNEYEQKSSDPAIGNLFLVARDLSEAMDGDSMLPALFPPPGTREQSEEWFGIGRVLGEAIGKRADAGAMAMLERLQSAIGAEDHGIRQQRLVDFRDAVVARAKERGEYRTIELENTYLAESYHYKALHWFLVALLVVAAGWFVPRAKWLWWAGVAATVWPLGLLVWDIVLRCVIRNRPPVLNLYDTFLFIAAVGVAAAVVAEVILKRRVVIALAPIFGALLVMLARAFELEDGKDQMAPLQAVLDTNYYLATHVTSINVGYGAGMLAALVATAWLWMQALGFRRHDQAFHKGIVRATYGIVAFGLIFAVFGTIYGGVWANDSWGRFWGWDPKENGALLICIAQVALLHARMCGWVRDLGFCISAAMTGVVIAFSWFHVNLLGIGLHSYGFASGTKVALVWYYSIQTGLVLLAVAVILLRRALAAKPAPATIAPAA